MLCVAWHVPSPQSGEPFSVVEWFKASFEDCEENKVRRFRPDALDPHRAAPRSSQHPPLACRPNPPQGGSHLRRWRHALPRGDKPGAIYADGENNP